MSALIETLYECAGPLGLATAKLVAAKVINGFARLQVAHRIAERHGLSIENANGDHLEKLTDLVITAMGGGKNTYELNRISRVLATGEEEKELGIYLRSDDVKQYLMPSPRSLQET